MGKKSRIEVPAPLMVSDVPFLLDDWDYMENGFVDPLEVPVTSSELVHWRCSNCRHTWIAPVSSRYFHKLGCPNCSVSSHADFSSVLDEDNNLKGDNDSMVFVPDKKHQAVPHFSDSKNSAIVQEIVNLFTKHNNSLGIVPPVQQDIPENVVIDSAKVPKKSLSDDEPPSGIDLDELNVEESPDAILENQLMSIKEAYNHIVSEDLDNEDGLVDESVFSDDDDSSESVHFADSVVSEDDVVDNPLVLNHDEIEGFDSSVRFGMDYHETDLDKLVREREAIDRRIAADTLKRQELQASIDKAHLAALNRFYHHFYDMVVVELGLSANLDIVDSDRGYYNVLLKLQKDIVALRDSVSSR